MFCVLKDKMKKMTVVDISLVKFSVFFFAIMLAKFFPALLNLSYPVLVVLVLACGAKPFYKTWLQK